MREVAARQNLPRGHWVYTWGALHEHTKGKRNPFADLSKTEREEQILQIFCQMYWFSTGTVVVFREGGEHTDNSYRWCTVTHRTCSFVAKDVVTLVNA
jgi:hypothetical protein